MTHEPVFIVGCPRSGTTLLAALIDRHSSIAVPPETYFFSHFCSTLHSRRRVFSSSRLARSFVGSQYTCDLQLDEQRLRRAIGTQTTSLDRLLTVALTEFAAARGKVNWAEKTPEHLFFVPKILRWYSDARIVCITRDGRDVALSMRAIPWTVSPIRGFSAIWREAAVVAQRYARQFPENFFLLRFEDLLADPPGVLGGVMRFIEFEFETGQLDASRPTGVVAAWEMEVKRNVFAELDPTRAYAWKESASSAELRVMNSMMRNELTKLGYTECEVCTSWVQGAYDAILNRVCMALYHHRSLPARRLARRLLGRFIPPSPHTNFTKPAVR